MCSPRTLRSGSWSRSGSTAVTACPCTHERRRSRRNQGGSPVSTEQRENLEAILRQSAFPVGSDVNEQRRLLREAVSAQPLPKDVTVTAAALGGIPTAEITVEGVEPR